MASADQVSGFDRYEQHVVTGGEYLKLKRDAEARAEFEAAVALQPENTKALSLLGLTLFRMSAFEDALPVYRKLVEKSPNDPSLRLNLGLVHLKLGNADQAIEALSHSRELDPSQSRAVSYLGLAYARNGQYAEAYQAFLQGGQTDLAREMEQYLSEEERAAIAAQVARPGAASEASDGQAAAEPEDEAADPDIELSDDDVVEESDDSAVIIQPSDDRSAISRAVESAAPSSSAAAAAVRTAAGHQPPQALSEFATGRLIRPEDGDHPFEISAGGVLIVRVDGRVMSRTEGVIVSGGDLAYEPATRRVRGRATDEPFGADGRPVFFVSGQGHLVASPLGEHFAAVMLDDDILYLREDLVFAFQERVRWENGHVPGSAAAINMVQFRGEGAVALRSRKPLLSVKLAPEKVLYVDADALAGWIGRVVPRLVQPAAGGKSSASFVECSGEGVVLLDQEVEEADLSPSE